MLLALAGLTLAVWAAAPCGAVCMGSSAGQVVVYCGGTLASLGLNCWNLQLNRTV